jgi:hypothetical protein
MKPTPRSRPSPPTFWEICPPQKEVGLGLLLAIFHSCKEEKFEWEERVDFWRREKRGKHSFCLEKEGYHTMGWNNHERKPLEP